MNDAACEAGISSTARNRVLGAGVGDRGVGLGGGGVGRSVDGVGLCVIISLDYLIEIGGKKLSNNAYTVDPSVNC